MNNHILSSEKTNYYGSSSPFVEAYEEESQLDVDGVDSYVDNNFAETPFSHAYESLVSVDGVTPEAEEFSQLFHELYDKEFDQEIYDLASSFRAELDDIQSGEINLHQSLSSSLNVLEVKIEPVIRESERIVDEYIKILGEVDLLTISEKELDDLLDSVDEDELDFSGSLPIYEDFKRRRKRRKFGKWLKKKIKKAAKYAAKTAKTFVKNPGKAIKNVAKDAINFAKRKLKKFLNGLKKLVRKLFAHVIKVAAGILPKELRPIAKRLAKKISKEVEEFYPNEYAFDNGVV